MSTIRVNTHSSIRISTQGQEIYIDPYMIERDSHDAYAILLTHSHYDHFSPDDIKKIRNSQTIFIAPFDMVDDLRKLGVAEENLFIIRKKDMAKTRLFSALAIPAYNIKKDFHPKEKGWLGYLLTINGQRIYVAGDTDVTQEALEVKCDIALVPIGGKYTMDLIEASKFVNAIKPKIAVPIHYGSIVGNKDFGERFSKLVDKDIKVKLLIK